MTIDSFDVSNPESLEMVFRRAYVDNKEVVIPPDLIQDFLRTINKAARISVVR